ncbi:hypothetical protein K3495_g12139 [Podosphaera aphanis]|nr:hypothetical protein K3495_g12139 [Podosphaera aphanis]
MQELLQIVWGTLPPVPPSLFGDSHHLVQSEYSLDGSEPSLLRAKSEFKPAKGRFYVHNIFAGCKTISEAYHTLRFHLSHRLDWANIRVSFKKVKLYMDSITVLGLVHEAGGIIEPKHGRADKIRAFLNHRII